MAEEFLSLEGYGWVRWMPTGYVPGEVRIRFEPGPGERLTAVELRLTNGDGLRADWLRQIPLARLERWVNAPHVRHEVLLAPEELDRRSVQRSRLTPRISVPDRRGRLAYPDSFYKRVAEVASAGHSARSIAEASEVPATTVARWIKGARDRGFLAPSRREDQS